MTSAARLVKGDIVLVGFSLSDLKPDSFESASEKRLAVKVDRAMISGSPGRMAKGLKLPPIRRLKKWPSPPSYVVGIASNFGTKRQDKTGST
jgi:hypothetical protein